MPLPQTEIALEKRSRKIKANELAELIHMFSIIQ